MIDMYFLTFYMVDVKDCSAVKPALSSRCP